VTRRLIYAANWKMNHGLAATRAFAERFNATVRPAEGRELWFFPPAVSLAAAVASFGGRPDARVGAQNVYWPPRGAFTGETSVALAAEAGARGALVGHSERRHIFGETDAETARKLHALLEAELTPMLCVGELLSEREDGQTETVVRRQLRVALEGHGPQALSRLMVAYEPVWAIGTGRNATPADAAAVHRVIRTELAALGVPAGVPVLYGGSVNAGNVLALLAEDELDGVLVGGASLDPDGWAELVGLGG
jgi:triosephosphate isomerase (TIM)